MRGEGIALPLDGDLCRCLLEGVIAPDPRVDIGRCVPYLGIKLTSKGLPCPWTSPPVFFLMQGPLFVRLRAEAHAPPPLGRPSRLQTAIAP